MASYKILTPITSELDNGLKLNGGVFTSTQLNGQSLKKGSGCIKVKEVNADGSALSGGTQAEFYYGVTISGL